MKKLVFLLIVLTSIRLQAQKPPVYINLVSHNEDTYTQYLSNPPSYFDIRIKMILFAEMCQNKGAKWHLGSDWILPIAVFRNDTGSILSTTGGKNILRYLNEDLNISIDVHSHESSYSKTDVFHLLDTLGVNVSEVLSGFLVNQLSHGHLWMNYQNPVPGDSFPHISWQPKYLWGAGTPGHVNDPFYTGIWKPKDTAVTTDFITHDSTKYLINYGQGCKIKLEATSLIDTLIDPLRDLINAIQNGTIPEDGIYCTSIFFNEASLALPNFINLAGELIDSINHYVALGQVEWMKIDSVGYLWDSSHMDPSIHDCSEYSVGIEHITSKTSFLLYPNPSTGFINIECSNNEKYMLEVYDLSGRLIQRKENISGAYQLNTSSFPSGSYLIRLQGDLFVWEEKFVKM
ncbi:MAG: T9SS type A sorting domain-containing protein [Spirochaetes bacterium]|nr:T9SS type A sorting domain-containing protein [Spirochaetota bacterium]